MSASAGHENEITETMKSEDAIKNMTEIINSSISEFGVVMFDVAQTANTLMKQRIVETGKDAQGNMFPPYSEKPSLVNCSNKYMSMAVCNQLTGSKEKRKELKWVTIKRGDKTTRLFELEGGYKQFRELHGRQTSHVDFTFSGEMMANIQVVSDQGEHKSGRARISTLSDEKNLILAGNTERKGEILMLSDGEVNEISGIIENWLAEKWNE